MKAEELQPIIIDRFQRIIEKKQLAHAYLLTGNSGIGKQEVAEWIAMRLFCNNLQNGRPCGKCFECQRILNKEHPDVVEVAPDGQTIKVDQVRFLKSEFSKSGVEGNQKVFIILDANKMTTSASNSLLKFIEEPTGNVFAFLLTENRNLMLPTIISRTEVIELNPLSSETIKLEFAKLGASDTIINVLSELTNSDDEAKILIEDEWIENAVTRVYRWFTLVTKGDMEAFVDVQTRLVMLGIDRFHQETLLSLMMLYGRDLLRTKVGAQKSVFGQYQSDIEKIAEGKTLAVCLQAMDIMLKMPNKLQSNIGFQTILETATINLCQAFK